jgi:hypothetical protein
VTVGVAASSYAVNMAVKQNAADHAVEFPAAAKAVDESFYMDDGLAGADLVKEAIDLQRQLQGLFSRGGFTLRKWSCSNPVVLTAIPDELQENQFICVLPEDDSYTKTLRVEWNTVMDHFSLSYLLTNVTKRLLVSDVAKTFDILGWFSLCTIMMKSYGSQRWTGTMKYQNQFVSLGLSGDQN